MAQVVEDLPSKHEALNSNLSTANTKQNNKATKTKHKTKVNSSD
jgi:hypothetical protein